MTTALFTDDQIAALRILHQTWSKEKIVLIGASALGCFLEMRWRQTYDLDISISMSAEEYAYGLENLPGWELDPHIEQRWIAPGNVRIDIIPAGPKLLKAGEIVWPKSLFRMSLLGLRLAFEESVFIRVRDDLKLRVAPLPVIALLKIAAYQDRPYDRLRDLLDLSHILEDFLPDGDSRRFTDEAFDLGLSYEETSAYFLGKDIGAIVNEVERKTVTSFISMARNDAEPNRTQTQMLMQGPASWHNEPANLLKRLDVFERGLGT